MSPLTLAVGGAVALIVLIPPRRLQLRGWSGNALAAYFAGVWLLGMAVAVIEIPARFLVPVLLVAYLAPFVTWREGLGRLRGGPLGGPRSTPPPARPNVRNVTPPDQPATDHPGGGPQGPGTS